MSKAKGHEKIPSVYLERLESMFGPGAFTQLSKERLWEFDHQTIENIVLREDWESLEQGIRLLEARKH